MDTSFTGKQLIHIDEVMNRIRVFEERALKLYKEGVVTGSVHLYIGEEAIAATACELLDSRDYITSNHRGNGHCIAKGHKTDLMMAELFGRETGYCCGKGGSMHISDLSLGNLGANGIVAGGTSIAVGAALSQGVYLKNGGVTLCFFGEGASNEGVTHESMNLAAVWKLPVVFICENNLYQVFTSVKESLPIENVASRAAGYGMSGEVVDGNDVFALEKSLRSAIERARSGGGPSIIEAKTYRWDGHYPGDGYFLGGYRTVEEVDEWKEKCPIRKFEGYLLEKKIVTEEWIESMRQAMKKEIDDAVAFAGQSPWPRPEKVYDDVFFDPAPKGTVS
ncbi:MAG: thiamine pyrophosphate-dependent dehydrogenase E1 component subunit alpha [Treponema sp.]|nr:thiamine pyrophosphate-dependent dehydrogenase E1 component subunit alpha [Treponema sp.]